MLLVFQKLIAQDISFAQFSSNPIYYNPAYTGDASDLRIGLNYRNQWPNIPGKFAIPGPISAYNVYVDKQFRNLLVGGLGVFAFQSYKGEGFLRHTSGGFSYAWHMPTQTKNFNMYFGFKFSVNQLSLDWSRLRFSDQVDPNLGYLDAPSGFVPPNDGKKIYVDLDAGTVIRFNFTSNWSNELGFSAAHLPRQDISLIGIETRLPIKYVALYSTSFPISDERLYLNPKFLFEKQDEFIGYTSGLTLYVTNNKRLNTRTNQFLFDRPLYLDFYFRNTKLNEGKSMSSIIIGVGHSGHFGNNNTRYQVGVSWDCPVGGLSARTHGAFEISSTIILNTDNQRRRQGRCIRFQGNPLGPIN